MLLALTASDILKSSATAYATRGITLLAAYLAQKGLRSDDILTPENITILAGSVVAVGADLALTFYRKAKEKNLLQAARDAEPGARLSTIKADAESMPIIPKG